MKMLGALAILALALLAAACSDGGDEPMGDMAMGNPTETRADELANAELATGIFVLLETRPPGYDGVSGEAWMALHDGGTTVTLEVSGLLPDVEYVAHLHEGSCSEGGGPHFAFDHDGPAMPPNEVHLAFTGAADGGGFMTAVNERPADHARSIVIHPMKLLDNKVACAEFG